MSLNRVAVPALALLAAACAAQPKSLRSTTDVTDSSIAAAAPAPAPAPAPERIPGACGADADCAAGQTCAEGRCVAASSCDVLRVNFAFDSAQLDERAMKQLRLDAGCLSQRRVADLLIEGHCDERGTTAYNIALGSKRADAVKRYLADLGLKTRIDTISFGKELPVAQGTGETTWAQNRRAELRLPGETRSDGQRVAGR
jgi:outer membrane protein OmpA-like peptidoglycan-associated protein